MSPNLTNTVIGTAPFQTEYSVFMVNRSSGDQFNDIPIKRRNVGQRNYVNLNETMSLMHAPREIQPSVT
jgi:hypothetical protein